MSDFRSLEASIRTLPEEKARGDAFERAVLHHVVRDPTVEITEAWLWDEWPDGVGLGRELGVDIVGRDPEGRLVAIQAKFRSDPRRLLRWDDVDSFLAYRPDLFPRRLLVTNALDRNANVRRATQGRIDTEWLFRNDLAASEHWPAAEGRWRPSRPRPKSPLPYQKKAIKDTVRVLEGDERAQLVMACGTGKTLVSRPCPAGPGMPVNL